MTRSGLTVVPGERLVDAPLSWEALLRASVRPAFQVDAYLARPGDPVLFGPGCVVAGCDARGLQRVDGLRGHLCDGHARMWRRDGQPPQAEWVTHGARELRHRRPVAACSATGCPRSVSVDQLCRAHRQRWVAAGRPPLRLHRDRGQGAHRGRRLPRGRLLVRSGARRRALRRAPPQLCVDALASRRP